MKFLLLLSITTLAMAGVSVHAQDSSSVLRCSFNRGGLEGQIYVLLPNGISRTEPGSWQQAGEVLEIYPNQPRGAARVYPCSLNLTLRVSNYVPGVGQPGGVGLPAISYYYAASGTVYESGRTLSFVADPDRVSYLDETWAQGTSTRYSMRCR